MYQAVPQPRQRKVAEPELFASRMELAEAPAWAERPLAQLALGVLLLALVEMIPWVGGVVAWFVVLPVLGVIWDGASALLGRARPTPSSPMVAPPAAGAPMSA